METVIFTGASENVPLKILSKDNACKIFATFLFGFVTAIS